MMINIDRIRAATCPVPKYRGVYWVRYGTGYQRAKFLGYARTAEEFVVWGITAAGVERKTPKKVHTMWTEKPRRA